MPRALAFCGILYYLLRGSKTHNNIPLSYAPKQTAWSISINVSLDSSWTWAWQRADSHIKHPSPYLPPATGQTRLTHHSLFSKKNYYKNRSRMSDYRITIIIGSRQCKEHASRTLPRASKRGFQNETWWFVSFFNAPLQWCLKITNFCEPPDVTNFSVTIDISYGKKVS